MVGVFPEREESLIRLLGFGGVALQWVCCSNWNPSRNSEKRKIAANLCVFRKGGAMARRRHQRGCVILKGKVRYGKYRDDVVEQDGTVTRVQRRTPLGTKKEYPTKRLAERKLEQVLCRINAAEYRPGRVATLAEFAERWKVEILTKYKPSTKCSAGSHLNSHILPYLGKLRLDVIGVENQQAFVTHLAEDVSYKSVLNILSTLSCMLTTAKNWGYVCEGVDQHKLVLPGREEVGLIIQ